MLNMKIRAIWRKYKLGHKTVLTKNVYALRWNMKYVDRNRFLK